ncbi:MAG: serine dehydratase subunit alpha family protein [Oscillospiraceae bacterium]|nr:serine dehydratase subunit alpha family protein [Oscillospiraceae bacterium]
MDSAIYQAYTQILHRELVPAMGCTEPIAVAYAAAVAARELGQLPEKVEITVSANIIKNVKSVIVPNTGGLHGLEAAAAAGILAGDPDKKLLVISQVTDAQKAQIKAYLQEALFCVKESPSEALFDIVIRLERSGHSSLCRISGGHTNIVKVVRDREILLEKTVELSQPEVHSDLDLLNIESIVEYADCVVIADVEQPLSQQIRCNMAIAQEGLDRDYGARVGQVLLGSREHDTITRAKAYAAAASDARMGGCELPVVINSGSGNQGITASVPVVIYARDMGATDEQLYRALVVSNLVTLHLKSGIGPLSAYCGAISAGCGAAAGITYLQGGKFREVAHTVVNAIAINSGVICDGAKASCAAKIASAVEAGILGMEMFRRGSQFVDGDGIVSKGVENTIRNICQLASEGMRHTDAEIIKIMLS